MTLSLDEVDQKISILNNLYKAKRQEFAKQSGVGFFNDMANY
jgi:hypothetical protein